MADDTEVDITIETLTGTIYELRISIFETILGIKARIQRLEGLPVYQQVLVYNSQVLHDDLCLLECGVGDGSRMQLIVAMRGGPVQTASVVSDDYSEIRYDDDEDEITFPFILYGTRDGKPVAFANMNANKDQDKKRNESRCVVSRPSTVRRQEREAIQLKVDRLKGQLKEMKKWRSQQSLNRRNHLQAKPPAEMSTHRSFEHLPVITEKRTNVTCKAMGSSPRRKVERCDECGKKTGLATVFSCRCGGSFCTKHRYAESHRCSFDYKTAGKKTLTRENPVVTAPKLPKI